MSDTPPVLLLIFNRPDLTREVMAQIREAEPPKLFVGADGPRTGNSDDLERCEQARRVATQVDWDCEVHTLFRDENLGLKEAVSSAITWFFEHVEAGIILEDDCVPDPTFFPYCAKLLSRYCDDKRVMVVSGNNFQPEDRTYRASYYFSIYNHCWGWATWRDAWTAYDGTVPDWPSLRKTSWLEGWLGRESEAKYWAHIFNRVYRDEVDSWAYPWTLTCWKEHGLSVLPAVNLVSNIGFGGHATNTKNTDAGEANLPSKPLSFPLSHPSTMVRSYRADHFTAKHHFGIQEEKDSWQDRVRQVIPERLKAPLRSVFQRLRR
jgi:hypothetical protein